MKIESRCSMTAAGSGSIFFRYFEAFGVARIPAVIGCGAQGFRIGSLQVRGEANIAASALGLAKLDHRHHEHQHDVTNILRAALRLQFVQHFAAAAVQHGGAVDSRKAALARFLKKASYGCSEEIEEERRLAA